MEKSKSLSQRVVVSGFWAFLLRAVNRAFSFIRLIILARVLAPDDFGLMGIASALGLPVGTGGGRSGSISSHSSSVNSSNFVSSPQPVLICY